MLKPQLANGRAALDGYRMAKFIIWAPGFKPGQTEWSAESRSALTAVTLELEAEALWLLSLEILPQRAVET